MLGIGGFIPADVPKWEADALIWLYNAAGGASWTNNTNWLTDTTVGNWFGITVAGGHVTDVKLVSNGLNGDIGGFPVDDLSSMTDLWLYGNVVSGNISGWALPNSVEFLRINSTSLSGDLSGWTVPSSMVAMYLFASPLLSGDISGWVIPSAMQYLRLYLCGFSAGPDMSGATGIIEYRIDGCSLSQAAVDAVALGIYTNRASYGYATPTLNVGGSNSAPSGTYQDGDPPTTGKEYIFEIENDPETEGFNKWAVTYTA